jgi:probable HAF family extracellular repeat protein
MKRFVHLLAGACLALAGSPALSAWIVHDLGSPNDRVTDIRVAAVNDRGEITGGITMTGATAVPERAAFVLDRNGFHLFGESLDTPPTVAKDINRSGTVIGNDALPFIYGDEKVRIPGLVPHASANAINDRGVVVGGMQAGPGALHAFEYADGTLADLGTLGGSNSQAFGINRRGDVVGSSTLSDEGFPKAFVRLAGGTMMPLGDSLGGRYSVAYGINNRGDIAGSSETEHLAKHGFLYRDGIITDLGVLPFFQYSDAVDLNDKAEVVGVSLQFLGGFDVRPFLWRDGAMIDIAAIPELAAAGFTSWIIHGELVGASFGEGPGIAINNHGQVVGAGMKDGKPRLFLLTPRGRRD